MTMLSFHLSQLTLGAREQITFTVSPEDMQRFAELSGDHNPLHTDEAFARQRGYKGVVVYGALIIAKLSQLIGMRLPGRDSVWSGVQMRFHQPLYVGEAAQIEAEVTSVSQATGLIDLSIKVTAGERLLAKGKAEILLPVATNTDR